LEAGTVVVGVAYQYRPQQFGGVFVDYQFFVDFAAFVDEGVGASARGCCVGIAY
jgi:hypothetical protein